MRSPNKAFILILLRAISRFFNRKIGARATNELIDSGLYARLATQRA